MADFAVKSKGGCLSLDGNHQEMIQVESGETWVVWMLLGGGKNIKMECQGG